MATFKLSVPSTQNNGRALNQGPANGVVFCNCLSALDGVTHPRTELGSGEILCEIDSARVDEVTAELRRQLDLSGINATIEQIEESPSV